LVYGISKCPVAKIESGATGDFSQFVQDRIGKESSTLANISAKV
jgi:hypothetical protein